ncbi:ribonuclease H-like domain-containing protein [Halovivax gelatinilyticus]|uniref:ribonuclease H-like domain-containing protein n=1 Tax=Halovivax gelatinilyticus TaxID=2961597 RepID=UPI0020CA8F0E|nr:ribonuclease H-like domain-containing protein [Halovivax gelatinilyticus]
MQSDDRPTLLAIPASMATREPSALVDVREEFDPDGVWIPGPARDPRATARIRQFFDVPVVHPPLGSSGASIQRHTVGSVTVVTVSRGVAVPDAASVTAERCENSDSGRSPADRVLLVCDDIGTTVDRTTLNVSLSHGEELLACVPEDCPSLTVLTGRLPASYDRFWHLDRTDRTVIDVYEPGDIPTNTVSSAEATALIRICGIGSDDGDRRSDAVVTVELSDGSRDDSGQSAADGDRSYRRPVESITTIGCDAFGIRAVDGIGRKTAEELEAIDITSRRDLVETTPSALESCPGIGPKSATRMCQHATVLETDRARRLTTESLPGSSAPRPPLCLDIETDGLSPTIIWQIGVYDPAEDDYRVFVERSDPSDPARVLESFLEWLIGTHYDRSLLTWNGYRFDYRHLSSFIERYVPHYAEGWRSMHKHDLYHWAVVASNALCPGRSNRLDVVANAIGYDGLRTGLDGAETATAYSRFIRTGDPLEWDRHERYCEDDCRRLWAVYEHLENAQPSAVKSRPTQTGLGDF